MSERLAIKTDQVDDWEKRKVERAVKNLTPRPNDNGLKSSWAHCSNNDEGELPAILHEPAQATCRLQALALYIFSERYSNTNRNKVRGVSLLRTAIGQELIIEDECEHPIPAYCVTHRSLIMSDEQRRRETVEHLLAEGAFEAWEYSREEMAELLEDLLAGNHISPGLEAVARSLLLQWNS